MTKILTPAEVQALDDLARFGFVCIVGMLPDARRAFTGLVDKGLATTDGVNVDAKLGVRYARRTFKGYTVVEALDPLVERNAKDLATTTGTQL